MRDRGRLGQSAPKRLIRPLLGRRFAYSRVSRADDRRLLGSALVPFLFRDSQEGAVEAVLRLCKTDHLVLRGYCSAILKQFAATPVLREKLVARGGVRPHVFLKSFVQSFIRCTTVAQNSGD